MVSIFLAPRSPVVWRAAPLLALLLLGAFSSANANAEQTADGAALYAQQCVVCHGAAAQGVPALASPQLAGQSSAYMQRQLTQFKAGVRGQAEGDRTGAQMVAIASGLDAVQMVAVSDYLSRLPADFKPSAVDGDVRSGAKLYQSYCGSCHGSDAIGNEMLHSPNLRVLSAAYFTAQYQKFLNGQRGSGGGRSDKFGRQMSMMAAAMPEAQQIADVAAYIESLNAAALAE